MHKVDLLHFAEAIDDLAAALRSSASLSLRPLAPALRKQNPNLMMHSRRMEYGHESRRCEDEKSGRLLEGDIASKRREALRRTRR